MLNLQMPDESCEKILVRGVNWIGDAVMTLPAVRSLRKAFPVAKISLLVNPLVAPLFENNSCIDEIIEYRDRSLLGKIRLSMELKKKRFSCAILFQNAFDAALIANLSGIPRRVGYERDFRGYLLTDAIPYAKEDRTMHHVDYYLNLLRKSGIKAEFSIPWLHLLPEERLWARDYLKGLRRPVFGINPGAAFGSAKRWFPERFSDVIFRVITDIGGSAVIFGGHSDVDIAGEIISNIPVSCPESRILSLAGKTTLRQLSSLISECDALLSNDSGPMHIGYAVRTPVVAIFGSTDPSLTGPVGGGHSVIRKKVSCGPCFEKTCGKKTMSCMAAITSDDVFDSIKKWAVRKRAVFFDRDGTLCRDKVYLNNWRDFEIFSGISELKKLQYKGLLLIGITNQSGISKGVVNEGFVREVSNFFIDSYGFNAFYYCPHRPEDKCSCRKPEPELLFKAREEYNIDLKGSFFVGDKEIDMLTAQAVGAKAVLVQTGEAMSSQNADYIARDLTDAVEWIVRNS